MIGFQLTSKCQITIPAEVRKILGVRPGDRVIFQINDDAVIVKGVNTSILDLRGSIKPKRNPENFNYIRKQIKQTVSQRISHR